MQLILGTLEKPTFIRKDELSLALLPAITVGDSMLF